MKGKLNIYRDTFLEKEELDRLINFINDNPALFLFVSSTQQFGIISQNASIGLDPAFKVEVGTNVDTIKVVADSYALNNAGLLIYQKAFDNLPVPNDSKYYWVKISHRYDNYEAGFVDIAQDGTLSGSDTLFTEVLRGISSGFPVKVKFFTQNSDGSLTPATNSGVYEVTSVASDTTAVLTGNFSVESNLRYVVLGAFSIKTSIAAITSNGMYSYDSCNIEFIEEETTDTAPVTDFVEGEDFYIARIYDDGVGTFTIEDKRSDYYFRLNFGDILVNDRAKIDASNLDAGNITSWLSTLSLYTVAELDAIHATFLEKAENLNDLANKTTARSNLGVYGTSTIDGYYPIRTKIVALGDWNMDSDANYGGDLTWATLGVSDASKIRAIRCTIKSDSDVSTVPQYSLEHSGAGIVSWGTLGVNLARTGSGFFDSVNFNSTSYSRGWIIIEYVA